MRWEEAAESRLKEGPEGEVEVEEDPNQAVVEGGTTWPVKLVVDGEL